jgi:hypothetical protein
VGQVHFAQRGRFHVVDFWLKNAFMLDVLTEELKAEYLATQTLEGWRAGAVAMARKQETADIEWLTARLRWGSLRGLRPESCQSATVKGFGCR